MTGRVPAAGRTAGALLFGAILLAACVTWALRPTQPFEAAIPATPSAEGRFILYGDSRPRVGLELGREDATEPRLEIIRRLAEERPDFIVHSGDLVTAGSNATDWERFDREMEPIRSAAIPFYPALGNHEYGGEPVRALQEYFRRFPRLENRRWYELKAGPILILVLDTNYDKLSRELRDAQQDWYVRRLAEAEADAALRLVIVFGHHSPYTNARVHRPDLDAQERLVAPALKGVKARLFVTGHVHAYERFTREGRRFVVSGGGGAPRVSLRTGAEAEFRDEYAGGPQRPFHYCLCLPGRERLAVRMMMLKDGTSEWTCGDEFAVEYAP